MKRFLKQKFKIPDDTLVTVGYGKEQLKNTSDPFAAENRRVQIAVREFQPRAIRQQHQGGASADRGPH